MPAASEALALKLLKDTAANKFAAWMKEKYTLPRKEGQTRGAAPIQDGMNPKTWIPSQLNYIIENGKLSDEFASEVAEYQEHVKYEKISEQDVLKELEATLPENEFKKYMDVISAAKTSALKKAIAKERAEKTAD